MKTKCEKYFNVITNKVSDIINYLNILKNCIDKLDDTDKKRILQINKINERLYTLEKRLNSLPKGESPLKSIRQNATKQSTENAE